MWWFVIGMPLLYLAIGLCMAIALSQTPYAELPWWQVVLLWPLWVIPH